jgi:hypothetical protein
MATGLAEIKASSLDFSSEYSRNARLKPALLASLPIGLLALGYGLKSSVLLGALYGPLAAVGFTYLLAHLSRDLGTRKQEHLYRAWGGKPSITKLRHRDRSLNSHTRVRYHERAAALLGKPLPTSQEEDADPAAADELYEAYSNVLLERTRNTKTFRLLFEELISYGFRRNLLGMRVIGFPLCLVCLAIEIFLIARGFRLTGEVEAAKVIFAGLDGFLAVCWWLVITPDWVRRAANAYAERLLAASETLGEVGGRVAASEKPSTKKSPSKRSTRQAKERGV